MSRNTFVRDGSLLLSVLAVLIAGPLAHASEFSADIVRSDSNIKGKIYRKGNLQRTDNPIDKQIWIVRGDKKVSWGLDTTNKTYDDPPLLMTVGRHRGRSLQKISSLWARKPSGAFYATSTIGHLHLVAHTAKLRRGRRPRGSLARLIPSLKKKPLIMATSD